MHFSPLPGNSPGEAIQANSLEREVVNLGIAQFAKVWGIGSLMIGLSPYSPSIICLYSTKQILDLVQALNKLTGHSAVPLTPAERDLAVRYTTIAPAVRSKCRLKSLPI